MITSYVKNAILPKWTETVAYVTKLIQSDIFQNRVLPISLIFFVTLFQASAAALMKYAMVLMKANSLGKLYILIICVVMVLYGCIFPLYAFCLSRLKLSLAQPVFTGSMFLYTLLISVIIFNEKLALYKFTGFAAIIGGIIVVVI